jgi:hypothetical protein
MYDSKGRHERVTTPVSGYKCSCGVIYYYYGECPVCKEPTDVVEG